MPTDLIAVVDAWSPPPPFILEAPSVDEVTGGETIPDWLRTACPVGPLDKVASLGLLFRMWPHAGHAGMLRIVSFAKGLTEEQAGQLVQTALLHVDNLHDLLLELRRDAIEHGDGDEVLADAAGVINERDDLESVLSIVLMSGHMGPALCLRDALRSFDDEAVCELSAFPTVEALHDSLRLQTVFALEPDAWWGGFGAP